MIKYLFDFLSSINDYLNNNIYTDKSINCMSKSGRKAFRNIY